MPSPYPPEASFDLLVEALEARIAPTGLVGNAGSVANASDPNFLAYNTAPVPGAKLGFIPQGTNAQGINLYAIPLSGDNAGNGDKVNIFNGAGGSNAFPTFLQANNGQILAFFGDFDRDGQVGTRELVGISMGQGSAATVNGNVNGDVVANLAPDGLTRSDQNGTPATENITGFRAVSVTGSIVAGGTIANLNVSQGVGQILTGTAASGYAYHFNGDPAGGPSTGVYAVPAPGLGQAGPGLVNASLGAVGLIRTGDGGANANGGEITSLSINADANGFTILSGAGGGGSGAKAGNGGTISNLTLGLLPAVNDSSAHDPIVIQGGAGGAGEVGRKAGFGGSLDNVAVGFVFDNAGNRVQSDFLFADNVLLHGGVGGAGTKAGIGGSVTNSQVVVATPDNPGGAGAADPAVVKILAGDGGAQNSGGPTGKSGIGGSIFNVTVSDLNTDSTRTTFTGLPATATATNAQLLVAAGNAGAVLDAGRGRAGGSVDTVTLLGYRLDVTAGDGANGFGNGGAGGGLTNVTVNSRSDLLPTEIILDAGRGGRADNGSGGAGGSIATVRVNDSAFANLLVNGGTHANGGNGQANLGGVGGSVADVVINNSRPFFDPGTGLRVSSGTALVRGGDGGNGPNGGGAGGSLATLQITGSNFRAQILAGSGGAALADGAGGPGGSITSLGISDQPLPVSTQVQFGNAPDTSLELRAGAGGDGAGEGAAGAGGSIIASSLVATQNAVFTAGAGGRGVLGAAGSGGSITTSQALAAFGSVTVTAGSAGAQGGAAGTGGSINTFVGSAGAQINLAVAGDPRTDVTRGNFTLLAGAGSAGGAGGSVLNSGTTTLTPGAVTIVAGNGSGQNATAGAGGGIDGISGFVGGFGATRLVAGNGGSGDGTAGAGGSIRNVTLTGGLNVISPPVNPATSAPVPVALTFDAGAGGNAGGGRKGGNGGSIDNVTVANLATNTVLHHLAAGDGGGAQVKGGLGGSVTNVHVGLPVQLDPAGRPRFENADVGLRSGAVFGYDPSQDSAGLFRTAGGIFAGAGGDGRKPPRPGSVTDVNAAAIAAIVAGKTATPQLANMVDRIILNGLSQAQVNGVGDFTNFDRDLTSATGVQALKANVVGSVVSPAPGGGGSTFKFTDRNGDGRFELATDVPIDGLIAAINLGQTRNFQPEALLSVDAPTGQLQLVDLRAPGVVVVSNA